MSWFYFEAVSTYSETVTRGVTVYESHVLNVSHGHGPQLAITKYDRAPIASQPFHDSFVRKIQDQI